MGPSSPHEKGTAAPSFRPCLLWPLSPISATAELLLAREILKKLYINIIMKYLPISPVSYSHTTLGNHWSHFSPILFMHDSDYLHYRYLRIKRTATVTVQLDHDCLLTVTWTVLSIRDADARAAASASDLQHCWDVFVFQQDSSLI